MKSKKIELARVPAWQLSLITAVLSFILVFLLAGFGGLFLVKILDISVETKDPIEDLFAYMCTGILIAIACFIICIRHPKSIWYSLIICNAFGILAAFDPTFWSTERWIAYGIGWILSLIGAVVGISLAKRGMS